MVSDEKAIQLFNQAKKIAIVGLSDDPRRDSYTVATYLQSQGYRIVPINPNIKQCLGQRAYASLTEYGEPVDIVDVFRRSEAVPGIVDEAIQTGAKVVWTQLGVVNQEAATKAKNAGLDVVMDRCIAVEHRRLLAHAEQ